ncbi:hypothetical protein ACFQ80_01560 [Isoptericola sp. NPDC056578]|uniref:hypothetical protein n=1 Tax=Isoptericola sp. NPDC056578 TaxID=3345870 RepID=UPI00367C9D5D
MLAAPVLKLEGSPEVSPSPVAQIVLRPGYLLGMPTPSPSPIPSLQVLLQQQSEQGWWQDWGSSIVPGLITMVGSVAASLLVAYFALRGVKESAQKNAQSLIDAETERARNARDHDDYRWLRGARATAYFGIIKSTHAAVFACNQVVWFGRPKDPAGEKYEATNVDKMVANVEIWNDASTETRRWAAEVRAVGDRQIATLGEAAMHVAGKAIPAAYEAGEQHTPEEPYVREKVGVEDLKAAHNKFVEMVALIRMELGSDNAGVPEPESLAASSTTPQHED